MREGHFSSIGGTLPILRNDLAGRVDVMGEKRPASAFSNAGNRVAERISTGGQRVPRPFYNREKTGARPRKYGANTGRRSPKTTAEEQGSLRAPASALRWPLVKASRPVDRWRGAAMAGGAS